MQTVAGPKLQVGACAPQPFLIGRDLNCISIGCKEDRILEYWRDCQLNKRVGVEVIKSLETVGDILDTAVEVERTITTPVLTKLEQNKNSVVITL